MLENPHCGKSWVPFMNKRTGCASTNASMRSFVSCGDCWRKSSDKKSRVDDDVARVGTDIVLDNPSAWAGVGVAKPLADNAAPAASKRERVHRAIVMVRLGTWNRLSENDEHQSSWRPSDMHIV